MADEGRALVRGLEGRALESQERRDRVLIVGSGGGLDIDAVRDRGTKITVTLPAS